LSDRHPAPRRGARPEAPWYADGLRFKCTRCGECCRGRGSVEVSDGEIDALADHLGEDRDAFIETHTRPLRRGHIALRDQRGGDCIFLSEESDRKDGDLRAGCQVHAQRPLQCQSYPFWPAILHSEETWREESARCPGIGQGRLVDLEQLQRWLRAMGGVP